MLHSFLSDRTDVIHETILPVNPYVVGLKRPSGGTRHLPEATRYSTGLCIPTRYWYTPSPTARWEHAGHCKKPECMGCSDTQERQTGIPIGLGELISNDGISYMILPAFQGVGRPK